jgi:heme/copper-type cytochrome/quinol oxidase subunit 4
MKGTITSEVIGFILIVFTMITFFTVMLPKFLSTIIELFGKTSAENVARQLAGFITI